MLTFQSLPLSDPVVRALFDSIPGAIVIRNLVPECFAENHRKHTTGFMAAPKLRPMGAGLELSGLRKDRTEFPLQISLSPFQTEYGMLVCSSTRDMTARQQIEEALLWSELRYRLFETAKDGIPILGANTASADTAGTPPRLPHIPSPAFPGSVNSRLSPESDP